MGRRRGAQPGSYENVGVGGTAPALAPEIVVTLEEVNFCKGQIEIHWLVLQCNTLVGWAESSKPTEACKTIHPTAKTHQQFLFPLRIIQSQTWIAATPIQRILTKFHKL